MAMTAAERFEREEADGAAETAAWADQLEREAEREQDRREGVD